MQLIFIIASVLIFILAVVKLSDVVIKNAEKDIDNDTEAQTK